MKIEGGVDLSIVYGTQQVIFDVVYAFINITPELSQFNGEF